MSTQHDRFLVRVEASQSAVEIVANWLRAKGYTATVSPPRYAPSADLAWLYSDDGDIILADGRVVEVKGLDKDFLPWPFPRQAFIASVATVERRPEAIHIFLSRDRRTAGIVLPSTRRRWYVVHVLKQNTGNIEATWACPIECVIWKRVPR